MTPADLIHLAAVMREQRVSWATLVEVAQAVESGRRSGYAPHIEGRARRTLAVACHGDAPPAVLTIEDRVWAALPSDVSGLSVALDLTTVQVRNVLHGLGPAVVRGPDRIWSRTMQPPRTGARRAVKG